jgi:hypothetical protein
MPAVKNVGEPCAGEPHARIDGGREETGTSRQARAEPGASRLPDQPRAALGAQLAGVLERGDGPMLGERALVPARELAGIPDDRDDLLLADPDLDTPADHSRVQRVIVGVEADVRIGRHSGRPTPVNIRWAIG